MRAKGTSAARAGRAIGHMLTGRAARAVLLLSALLVGLAWLTSTFYIVTWARGHVLIGAGYGSASVTYERRFVLLHGAHLNLDPEDDSPLLRWLSDLISKLGVSIFPSDQIRPFGGMWIETFQTASAGDGWGVSIPLWLLFFALSGAWVAVRWVERRRVPEGHCPRCRYNLFGNTSGRCPECGTEVARPEAPVGEDRKD